MNDLTAPDLFMLWGFVAAYLLVLAAILGPRHGPRSELAMWLAAFAILAWPVTAFVIVAGFVIDVVRFLIRFMRAPH